MAFFRESILGPVPSNLFINNLEDPTECTFSKFVDHTKSASGEVWITQACQLPSWGMGWAVVTGRAGLPFKVDLKMLEK